MLDMKNFFFRQAVYCLSNPRNAYKTKKAMDQYRKANPNCAFCGRPNKIHVHHLVPIQYAPELAADPENFISLCGKRCHITIGHGGNYKDYVVNCKEICGYTQIIKQKDYNEST